MLTEGLQEAERTEDRRLDSAPPQNQTANDQTTAAHPRYRARKPKAPRPALTPRWPPGYGHPDHPPNGHVPPPLPTFVIAPTHTTGIS
jgi:hypothetical protein